jgi:hypothetical protein
MGDWAVRQLRIVIALALVIHALASLPLAVQSASAADAATASFSDTAYSASVGPTLTEIGQAVVTIMVGVEIAAYVIAAAAPTALGLAVGWATGIGIIAIVVVVVFGLNR